MLLSSMSVYAGTQTMFTDVPHLYRKDKSMFFTNYLAIGYDDYEAYKLLDHEEQSDKPEDYLFDICDDYECMMTYDFRANDEENPYPDIDEINVSIKRRSIVGGLTLKLGTNFKLFYVGSENPEQIELTESNDIISFKINKLGKYALYFNEGRYDVTFYQDTESGREIYYTVNNLKADEVIKFPPIPEREGYVFTGWKSYQGSGKAYVSAQPLTPLQYLEYYPSWYPEADYEPLTVKLTADDDITKGRENGKTVTVTLSDGFFTKGYDGEYDSYVTELENWQLCGSDDISIASAEQISDNSVRLTLSGNSKDIYTDGHISIKLKSDLIEFVKEEAPAEDEDEDADSDIEDETPADIKYNENGDELVPEEPDDDDDSPKREEPLTKAILDEDGVRLEWYTTENEVVLNKQKKTSSGGGGGVTVNTVSFNTDGAGIISSQRVVRNSLVQQPQTPLKDGYKFDGWYTDKELTNKYDFSEKVTKSFTLYAKWVKDEAADNTPDEPKTDNKIILTIGKKGAIVFGSEKESDVAPLIKNSVTMLPSRFVAEALGASVSWNEEKREVTIVGKNKSGENVEIVITIGSKNAVVNGNQIELSEAAFIENDRTYTPVRFISENLGASVDWNSEDNTVTINSRFVL